MTAAAGRRGARPRSHAPSALALRRFCRNRRGIGAAASLALVVLIAVAAPLLPLDDPNAQQLSARLLPPWSDGHGLGTDQFGRDILARLVWGTRLSLMVALVATAVAATVGTLVGVVAGYAAGLIDAVLMRAIDVLLGFPYLVLALAVVAILGPGLLNALIAIAIVNIPFFARTVRGATVAHAGRDYVAAARISGLGRGRILFGEILPNVLPAVVTAVAATSGWMILETAGLSFLGLGTQPPDADLGSMLAEGRQVVLAAPHVAIIPGIVVVGLVLCVNLVADALGDALDPRAATAGRARPAALTAACSSGDLAARQHSAPPPLLDVRNITVRFSGADGTIDAVDGASFALAAGERAALAGASGSGKSALAMALLRLLPSPPADIVAEAVRLNGEDLLGASLRRMQEIRGGRIGLVTQDPAAAFNPLLRVGEQVAAVVRRHEDLGHAEARDRVEAMLEKLRFPDPAAVFAAYPHTLSGGQLQRAAIARALIARPALIIADEPTTALDVRAQASVIALLDAARAETGAALLFISHDLGLIAQVCDRLMVMQHGRIVEEGTVDAVMRAPREAYTRALIKAIPRLKAPR